MILHGYCMLFLNSWTFVVASTAMACLFVNFGTSYRLLSYCFSSIFSPVGKCCAIKFIFQLRDLSLNQVKVGSYLNPESPASAELSSLWWWCPKIEESRRTSVSAARECMTAWVVWGDPRCWDVTTPSAGQFGNFWSLTTMARLSGLQI